MRGDATIVALADLLDTEVLELNAEHGEHLDVPLVAVIDEQTCIGCTLCIQACPVDAILGAAKHMHTAALPGGLHRHGARAANHR
jgi:electron transport complex protein RnfB